MSTARQDMYRLIYRSRSVVTVGQPPFDTSLDDILSTSRSNNARDGVTGALLLLSGAFLQALEGPQSALEATFERICSDLRHSEVELIEFSAAEECAFGDWSLYSIEPDDQFGSLLKVLQDPERRKDSRSTSETLRLFMAMMAIEQRKARRLSAA